MDIAITGIGIVSAIGANSQDVLASLKQGISGITNMKYLESEHKELPVGEVKLSNQEMAKLLDIDDYEYLSRTTLMGALAVKEAIDSNGKLNVRGHKKITFISGTTVGGMDITEKYYTQMKSDDRHLRALNSHDCGSSSDAIVDILGFYKPNVCTISTACSSALNAIIIGSEMLKSGETDIVIAGGTEALSKFHLNGFNTLMILDHERCRPFDATRSGINLGEGAAYLVLQRADDAKKEKQNIQGYITGYGNACDAFHQTASSENGEGAYLAMTKALAMASLEPKDIDYVNAHGTGTQNNDQSESVSLKRVFGEKMPLVSSTKAYTGHTTSASGSIEAVICLIAMHNNFVPGNLGWENPMADGIIPTLGVEDATLNNVLCNSFGFGGNDSSIVISSKSLSVCESEKTEYDYEIASSVVIDDEEQLKDYKEFISVAEARRMGKLMKAATITSMKALRDAGVECPDAIITATAFGMLETSEKFLEDMCVNGESLLKPTLFMQSTHNTIGSSIAIRTKCHGYNVTYTQGMISYDWALKDAERLIRTGQARTVLVGVHDESTQTFRDFQTRLGDEPTPMIYSKSIVLKKKED
ncbi:MAG: beta-ketoacyl-[acyl-carrier-protein] synthase family protein [Bacteroidaceae bacterium]|nr:beta-ketoacyl-[acyl-carrier-protein] synthase family protein [Bacteroidaceae bacterium]